MPSCSANTSGTAEQVYRQPKTGSNRLTLLSGRIWLISARICPSLVQLALFGIKNNHDMALSNYHRPIFWLKKRGWTTLGVEEDFSYRENPLNTSCSSASG